MDKRRFLFAFCAFVAALLVTSGGNIDLPMSAGREGAAILWGVPFSGLICAWFLAPKALTGTRSDVFRGALSGVLTVVLTPLVFGVALGLYAFWYSFNEVRSLGAIVLVFYTPVMILAGSIVFYGLISFPLGAAVGALIHAPIFNRPKAPNK